MKLTIELVPTNCHEVSLHRLLPARVWKRLRQQTIAKYGTECAVCGSASERLHCHEHWSYDDKTRARRLVKLASLCTSCHWVKHIELAKRKAAHGLISYRNVVNHFTRVNGVSDDAFFQYRDRKRDECYKRSQYSWEHDFGEYKDEVRPYLHRLYSA